MAMGARMGMSTEAIQTLSQLLSPAFPVGAFSYSHGLEAAHEAGDVNGANDLRIWLEAIVRHGAGRNDAIFLCAAYSACDASEVAEIDALARAMAPSQERLLETVNQGQAFAQTVGAVWGANVSASCYPVAVGQAACALGLPLGQTSTLYLQAFVANIVSAGVRLIPLGQTDGQRIVAQLSGLCAEVALAAQSSTLDDLGSATFLADIRSMQHETQYSRLYRS